MRDSGRQRQGGTRPCPVCGWEIQAEAVKCRYCGSPVGEARPAEDAACRLCRIAAGAFIALLLAGVVAFVLSAGSP